MLGVLSYSINRFNAIFFYLMIYLDNNATTKIDPRSLRAMLDLYSLGPLNTSSVHQRGQKAKQILIEAKESIASTFGCLSKEIIFTSGATEGLNTLIESVKTLPGHLLSTRIEHLAIDAKLQGANVRWIPVGLKGAPTLDDIQSLVNEKTSCLILSSVYSETGTMIDLEEIATFCEKRELPLIIDAVAHIGKEPFIFYKGISAFVFSAHKFHGPLGIGAMVVRRSFPYQPLLVGGPQESNRRAGTLNLPGIIGLKVALESIDPLFFDKIRTLRDRLEKGLSPYGKTNGTGKRVSNTLNMQFEAIDAETLLIYLDQKGVLASVGSACSSGALEPSRVLTHMGLLPKEVRSSLRFSLSRETTQQEIDETILIVKEIIESI